MSRRRDPLQEEWAADAARSRELLDERTRQLARPLQPDEGHSGRPVLVMAGRTGRYALPLEAVERVVPLPPVTAVPPAGCSESAGTCLGVIVVVGRLYRLVDPDALCRMPGEEGGGEEREGAEEAGVFAHAVLLRHPQRCLALAVRHVEDVAAYGEEAWRPVPPTVEVVQGISGDGILLLDAARLGRPSPSPASSPAGGWP